MPKNVDYTLMKKEYLESLSSIHDDLGRLIKFLEKKDPAKFKEIIYSIVEASAHINSYAIASAAFEKFVLQMSKREDGEPVPDINAMMLKEFEKLSEDVKGDN